MLQVAQDNTVKIRTRCRLCDSSEIAFATRFANMPQADAYTRDLSCVQPIYRCELWACQECGHAQIVQIVNPKTLFGHYLYRSGDFPYVVSEFRKFASETHDRFRPNSVLEIGSNDGTMLGFFKERGSSVLGVDPSDVASPHETVREFFGSKLADTLGEQSELVLAFNSFAHCDDLMDYVDGVQEILAPGGVFIFEASYLPDIVPGQFDKFDHEHLSYHSVAPLVPFFERHGLELFDVTRNPSKGGSIRGYVQHRGGKHRKTNAMQLMTIEEQAAGFRTLRPYDDMATLIMEQRIKLQDFMDAFPRPCAGFGASSSSTPLIYDLGLQHRISFLVDDNPSRWGLYSPGAHIPVREPAAMQDADYVLLLAWRYADKIMSKYAIGDKWVQVMPGVAFARNSLIGV